MTQAYRELQWSQLLTYGMTPEAAATIMGVPAGIAELELRNAASQTSAEDRARAKAAVFKQSNFPTIIPRERPYYI
ncbi:MAG: hypothetical protein ACLQVD_05395 [Capsulimonadaceae bacterium]